MKAIDKDIYYAREELVYWHWVQKNFISLEHAPRRIKETRDLIFHYLRLKHIPSKQL